MLQEQGKEKLKYMCAIAGVHGSTRWDCWGRAGTDPHTREQMWEGHLEWFLYLCDFLALRVYRIFWKKQKRKWEHIYDTVGSVLHEVSPSASRMRKQGRRTGRNRTEQDCPWALA